MQTSQISSMPEDLAIWDYDKLLTKVKDAVFDGEEPAPLLFYSFSKSNYKVVEAIGVTKEEMLWLQDNLLFLKKMLDDPVQCCIVYYLNRRGFMAYSVREMAMRTGFPEVKISRRTMNLLARRIISRKIMYYNRIYYILNIKMPTIQKITIDLVMQKFSPIQLEEMIKTNDLKREKVENRKAVIRKSRNNNYKRLCAYNNRLKRSKAL